MKIAIANDHHGIELKNRIFEHLKERNIEYVNYGCDEITNVDYVDYAQTLCNGIKNNEANLGILICGTGIGMSIAANKISGIICAKVSTPKEATLCKEHNRANVIALSEYTDNVNEIIDNFIDTKNSEEERHIRRVEKIMNLH